MAIPVKTLSGWATTRNTLVEAMTLVWGVLEDAPYSTDPASPYAKATADEATLLDALKRHAVTGLKEVDDAVAASDLVRDITKAASDAKAEADRITAIVHTIDDITGVVTAVTQVVTKFAALPFL